MNMGVTGKRRLLMGVGTAVVIASACVGSATTRIDGRSASAGSGGLCSDPVDGDVSRDYDVVVMTSERDNAFYVCNTVNSVLASAKFENLMISFSGSTESLAGALWHRCPELKPLKTAVMSASSLASSEAHAERIFQELKNASDASDAKTSSPFAGDGSISVDPNTTPTKERLVRLIREKLNYANALRLADGPRALLVLEDDVLLSHDFDEKLRCAQGEALAYAGGGGDDDSFVISAYAPGEMTRVRVPQAEGHRPRGLTQYTSRQNKPESSGRTDGNATGEAGSRSAQRFLKAQFYYGSQALLFSTAARNASLVRFESLSHSPTAKDIFSLPDTIVKTWAASEGVPLYSVIRGIVQHIGRDSTLFNDERTGMNTRFHQAPSDLDPVWMLAEDYAKTGRTHTTIEYD